jgi:dihydrofolate reductase
MGRIIAQALLLGRVTYESFAKAWPSREGEFADKFNSMPKYLVSSTVTDPKWNNTTVLHGNPVEAAAKLKQQLDGNIVVHGSAQLARLLDQAPEQVHRDYRRPVAESEGRKQCVGRAVRHSKDP